MKNKNILRILLASVALFSVTSCGGKVGPQGEQGLPGLNGQDGHTPSITIGENGNWFIDGVDTGVKASGETGSKGNDGTSVLNGNGVPEDTLGHNGDSYIDLDTWDYYTKANDTWIRQGNIKGDKGEDAETPTQEGTIGLDFYPLDDGTVGVRVGKASELSNIVIPSTYMGYTVSAILSNAFSGCLKLKTISIPDTIASIENEAFYGCSSLTSITIPNIVTSIGNSAFSGCSSLTSITIPNSVISIGSYAFSNCSKLTSITIPNSITSFGHDVFTNCSMLTIYCEASSKPSGWDSDWNHLYFDYYNSVNICCPVVWGVYGEIKSNLNYKYILCNDSVFINAYIGSSTEVVIPSIIDEKPVTSIGDYAFSGCSSLTSIVIPNSVTSIGSYAFEDCSSLTSITIPNSVTSISGGVFLGCSSLISIAIPDSVTSIADSAFEGCTSLTSITIPNSVTSIGDWAFSDCSSLTSIVIPDSIKSIGNFTFYGCSLLTIYCEASSKPSGWYSSWNPSNRPVVWGYTG